VSNALVPKGVTSLDGYFITHVAAGWSHSGFVSGLHSSDCVFNGFVECWGYLVLFSVESVFFFPLICSSWLVFRFWVRLHLWGWHVWSTGAWGLCLTLFSCKIAMLW